MLVSTKGRYALRVMIDLAENSTGGFIPLKDIAGRQDISEKYLENIISMLTSKLSLCVIAVDWSGYPSQEYHVLRASLICDGHSIPLLSWIVPSEKQQNAKI